ncbi:Arv1-domain-containing protein [Gloeophyllum trabeum ATCC 11539]|uniref:Protein ARV n=1 Tax=Gloeophyllum trabeum (strain ATCC 11539 / FP-39264 / Madison 617) TaxID=670483 RepID=S7Q474_GLOTA|nr:Arv1-domain-containing protein [Gloeophyllum trabeum ATCC 11539]EPQ54268.1 Arv1-domain-containing protein [Gloeophyllum trabeum ATCC 11539]
MPVCTTCTHPVAYLYTVYESAYNFRLEQCPACHAFADPYVEHDELTLILDLILLKRDVFRHLLFNRGTGARKAKKRREGNVDAMTAAIDPEVAKGRDAAAENDLLDATLHDSQHELARQMLIYKLGGALLLVDAIIRWAHLHPEKALASADLGSWSRESCISFCRIFVGCLIETLAFHLGILAACLVCLKCVDGWRALRRSGATASGIRQQFRLSHVPLTLLYSSLTKLFLLLLLSVWRPVAGDSNSIDCSEAHTSPGYCSSDQPVITAALQIFDEDKLDRDWVIRNVLGGMAAGFGLRVVLDCHPFFTTLIILFGWLVKNTVASFVSKWVGGDDVTGDAWLAYSIP